MSPKDLGVAEEAGRISDGSLPGVVYGTMLSTVILIKRNGEVLFIERDIWTHGPGGAPVRPTDHSTDRVFRFKLAIVPPAA